MRLGTKLTNFYFKKKKYIHGKSCNRFFQENVLLHSHYFETKIIIADPTSLNGYYYY
jgi:hypothetical protein